MEFEEQRAAGQFGYRQPEDAADRWVEVPRADVERREEDYPGRQSKRYALGAVAEIILPTTARARAGSDSMSQRARQISEWSPTRSTNVSTTQMATTLQKLSATAVRPA